MKKMFYKNKKNIEFQVGIFITIALIIVVVGYSWFTGFLEKKNYSTILVKFDQIGNIETGSPVSILGVKKGKVKNIRLIEDGVVLELHVRLDFPLKKGTEFVIHETDIMGGVQIEILPGNEEQNIDLSTIMNGNKSFGISDLVIQLSNVTFEIRNVLELFDPEFDAPDKIRSVITETNSLLNKMNRLIDTNSDDLHKMIVDLQNASENVSRLVNNNEEKITTSVSALGRILKDVELKLSEVNSIISDLSEFSGKINSENGTVNQLIQNKSLYDNLVKSTASLDSLLIDIKKNPKKYFQVKVF